MHGWYGLDVNEGPCTEQTFHLTAENPYAEYDEIRSFTHRYDNCASSSKDGKYAFNYYWNTPSDKNFVWLTDKSSTFYFYAGDCYSRYKTVYLGTCSKGNTGTTRTLSDLKSNKDFDSGTLYGSGCAYCFYQLDVSCDDSIDPLSP